MSITALIVIYAMLWFFVLFIVLPIRLKTQGDVGEIVPGTHAGAPANLNLKKRLKIVTAIATVLWVILVMIIVNGWITLDDVDLLKRFGPDSGV